MNPKTKKGYTFIELTVVIFLIGLTLVMTVPRVSDEMLTDDLKSTVRRMVGNIRSLRNDAIREQKIFKLCFDIGSNRYWIESAGMTDDERSLAYNDAISLPGGVQILDVWSGDMGKKVDGKAAIRFTKKGYIEQSVIHLGAEDGRKFTLELSPFMGKVKVLEKYVEFIGI